MLSRRTCFPSPLDHRNTPREHRPESALRAISYRSAARFDQGTASAVPQSSHQRGLQPLRIFMCSVLGRSRAVPKSILTYPPPKLCPSPELPAERDASPDDDEVEKAERYQCRPSISVARPRHVEDEGELQCNRDNHSGPVPAMPSQIPCRPQRDQERSYRFAGA
jgi:hypothetical protein